MTILQSFYTIAKNGGYFKTGKQASFLLANCENGMYRSSNVASIGFGQDGIVNCFYDVVVSCDALGVVSIVHIGSKTRNEKVYFNRTMSRDQSKAKQERMKAFKRCDTLESLYRSQIMRLNKLQGKTMGQRLHIIELIMGVEEKQKQLIAERNAL